MVVKYITLICLLFFVSCKNDKKTTIDLQKSHDLIISVKKGKVDSIVKTKKGKKLLITSTENKKLLKSIIYEKTISLKENDFNNIKSVLLETPSKIKYSLLSHKTKKNEIVFQGFRLANFLEYNKPYKEYAPFINSKTKQIDFIISYDESTEIPLKISFKKGQYFWFGKKFKWITPKIKINDTLQDDFQQYNSNSFSNKNNQKLIKSGDIFEYNNKKYLLFIFSDGIWSIHHLFDITDESKIKYYILNSIYTTNEGYGDFNNDGKLDFKQKYFYKRNSVDTTQNKYKIYTIK